MGDDSMIRFIDLGISSADWDRCRQFAFFDLIDNEFVNFYNDGDRRVWSSWADFERDLKACSTSGHFPYRTELTAVTIERFRSLCPEWVFNDNDAT